MADQLGGDKAMMKFLMMAVTNTEETQDSSQAGQQPTTIKEQPALTSGAPSRPPGAMPQLLASLRSREAKRRDDERLAQHQINHLYTARITTDWVREKERAEAAVQELRAKIKDAQLKSEEYTEENRIVRATIQKYKQFVKELKTEQYVMKKKKAAGGGRPHRKDLVSASLSNLSPSNRSFDGSNLSHLQGSQRNQSSSPKTSFHRSSLPAGISLQTAAGSRKVLDSDKVGKLQYSLKIACENNSKILGLLLQVNEHIQQFLRCAKSTIYLIEESLIGVVGESEPAGESRAKKGIHTAELIDRYTREPRKLLALCKSPSELIKTFFVTSVADPD